MKLKTNLRRKLNRTAANKAAARFHRLSVHLEQLEDRTLLSGPGDIEWVRQFGSVLSITAIGRAVDTDGNVYQAGELAGALPGQTSAGNQDAFVRKWDAAGNELWTRQFGSIGTDSAKAILVDASGVYVAGYAQNALPGQSSPGNYDAFVRKYDAAGNELWTREFGTTGIERAFDLAIDATGVYVAGSIDGGVLPGQSSGGPPDAFVRKYDGSGNELWTRQFGTNGWDQAFGIAADGSGIYVAGVFAATNAFVRKYDVGGAELWTRQFTGPSFSLSGDPTATDLSVAADASGVYLAGRTGPIALPGQVNAGGGDAFVRKYNPNGIELWTRQFGSAASDGAFSVAADASGVNVAGFTNGALPGQTSTGSNDAFVRRYDLSGSEIWTRQFGTTSDDDAFGVAADSSGIYVTGIARGILGQPASGSAQAFLRKYDFAGSELWTRQFNGSIPQTDIARAVDADGNVYVTGQVGVPLPGQIGAGGVDVFVRKYDAAGNELWTREFGTGGPDSAGGIAADSSGVYVAGYVFGTLPGQSGSGGEDAFIRKYDADGNIVWTRQFGAPGTQVPFNPNPDDFATGVAVDATGVYVGGASTGVFTGQTSAGGQDAFVRKYDLAGTELWTRQVGSSGTDQANGVAVDASGVYLAGFIAGVIAGQTSAGNQDAFVRKFAGDGAVVWTRQFGTLGIDSATGIAAGAAGISISGFASGTFAGQTTAGGQDAFVRTYDAAGNLVWTRQFGTAGADQANGIAVSDSGVYVAGSTAGVLPGQSSAGGQDAFIRKYDGSGTVIWTRQLGTPGTDSALGVNFGAAGLYITGSTTGAFPGQISLGLEDAFVAKIVDTVANTPPANVSLTMNGSVDENGTATLVGSFTDPDAGDTHTVVIDWGPSEGTTTLNLAAGVTTFSTTHLFADDNPTGTPSDRYSINATITEPAGNSASATASVTVNNVAPSNVVLSSGTINENGTFTLTGSFVDPGAQDTHTVVINWGAGEGTTTLSLAAGVLSFSADHQYLDDNPSGTPSDVYPISVTVTDDDAGSGSAGSTVTVNNVAPQAGPLSGPSAGVQITGTSFSGVSGEGLTFGSSFSDIGTLDTHQVSWNFGDGSSIGFHPSTDAGALATTHTYSAAGTYTISFIIRDDDGGEATVSGVVTILPWQLQADPCDPGLTALVVSGTRGNDTMIIHPGCDGTVQVNLNGTLLGSFKPTGRIVAYGQAGDDDIQVAGAIRQQVWLYGDAGNDRLNAGNGGSLLIGGAGNDQLIGGGGRDVMIGGEGADRLVGNSNDDILVAGLTTMDDRAVAGHDAFWCAVLDEWISGNSFRTRIQNLTNGLGGNAHNRGSFLLPNVRDDLSPNAVDFLNGCSGDDWLILIAGEDKVAGVAEATN